MKDDLPHLANLRDGIQHVQHASLLAYAACMLIAITFSMMAGAFAAKAVANAAAATMQAQDF